MQLPNSPFKILALAPFTMDSSLPWFQAPVCVDRHTLDDAMQAVNITGYLNLESGICPARGLELRYDTFKSLHPDGMAKTIPHIARLMAAKEFILQARKKGERAGQILEQLHQKWPDLPPIDLKDRAPQPNKSKSSSSLDNLLDMVALPGGDQGQKPAPKEETRQIDTLLENIFNAIFQLPAFGKMEAAWRGLRLLLQQGGGQTNVQVEIVPIHTDTLETTLDAIAPLIMDQLPSAVLLDIPFDNTALAMERLAKTAQWAATLMVPVIAWIPAAFFQIGEWEALSALPFLPNHTAQTSYAKYQKLRRSAEGNWISLACNRFLIRYPYGLENRPRSVVFNEASLPWTSPVWAVATLIAQSVRHTGWPTHLTRSKQINIQDLALHGTKNPPPMVVEARLDRDRRDQLIRSGLTPLASERDTAFVTRAVCISGSSLAYQLLTARVTRFVLWCKDNLPAETEPSALEMQLGLAFQVLSEQSRPPAFASAAITAGQPDDAGRIPVRITVTPSAVILPSKQKIQLEMNW